MTGGGRPTWARRPIRVEDRISVEADGTVVGRSGKVEFGQGIRTAFARIVAEELDVPIERVRIVLGETDGVPWDFGTFGSLSVATDGHALRAAAAYTRTTLVRRASERLQANSDELRTEGGRVVAGDGRSVAYEELVSGQPIVGEVPPEAGLGRKTSRVASEPQRIEAVDIVSGRACFVADVRLPGMLRGRVVAPPVPGARLRTLGEESVSSLPGAPRIVRDGDFVGVVADRDEHALRAAHALDLEWESPNPAPAPALDVVLREDDGVEAAFRGAARELRAVFHVPHIAHAPIGPSAAVADIRADGADLYVATQRPFGLRDEVAALLGVAPERVRVHPRMASGTYGRNNVGDAALDAVRLSRAAGRPVLVQWSREDEFRRSPHRPELDAVVRAGLDADGRVVSFHYDVRTHPHTYGGAEASPELAAMTSGRNAIPPYDVGSAKITLHVEPSAVRTAAFRSLAAAPNVFAIESFVDELAHSTGTDPIEFRLLHVRDRRLRRVLETVSGRSGWAERRTGSGHGFGVACAIYNGTYVAEVAEVSVDPSGLVRLDRVFCVADPGPLVHPDGGKNQIEGGVQQAASWTLLERLEHARGAVSQSSFEDYPIARFHDAPRDIDVCFTPELGAPSTGLGEPGSVPTAAAIANAVFAATGARVRSLPLSAEAVRAAMRAPDA